ncbi:hypothetical protein D3C72_2072400 [compost metagenome]
MSVACGLLRVDRAMAIASAWRRASRRPSNSVSMDMSLFCFVNGGILRAGTAWRTERRILACGQTKQSWFAQDQGVLADAGE